jgi:hypothetical protein
LPHTNSVKVLHPDGEFFAQRHRVEYLADNVRGYWRDPAKTVLVVLRSTDDAPANGYEYGGRISLDRKATAKACDLLTRRIIDIPIVQYDRTQLPVSQVGGATVMQMAPLRDHRSTRSQHSPRHDKLIRRQPIQRKPKTSLIQTT